jgi:hypothetical protein
MNSQLLPCDRRVRDGFELCVTAIHLGLDLSRFGHKGFNLFIMCCFDLLQLLAVLNFAEILQLLDSTQLEPLLELLLRGICDGQICLGFTAGQKVVG